MRKFDNADHTFYVEVLKVAALDQARRRLFDGKYVQLPGCDSWRWHVTGVRNSRGRDLPALRIAATELTMDATWEVNVASYLELRGDRYETAGEWHTGP